MVLQLSWGDDFGGPELSQYWIGGHLNRSKEVRLEIREGLRISFDEGIQYASAGVVSRQTIDGDFEAELRFDVSNPVHGTTFELAAILVPPPPFTSSPPSELSEAHRVFNVHGAPPYVSSEFDECDGWRIGWNEGDKQGGWDDAGEWRADNTENRYERSRFGPVEGPTSGWLKLSRTNGTLWQAYGRHRETDEWKESGTVETKFLSGPIYLRLVAKHWVKHRIGSTIAPANSVVLSNFKLRTGLERFS